MQAFVIAMVLVAGAALVSVDSAGAAKCGADAVAVGPLCVDKYEASVWRIDKDISPGLVKLVRKGKASPTALAAEGAQSGTVGDDFGASCPDTGNGCTDFYAVSVASVTPSTHLTWFQAAAACRNAGKRLLTNAEWQAAALGTPDVGADNATTDCAVASSLALTGARTSCVSDAGVTDMIGNVAEWVADWTDRSAGCTDWSANYGDDFSCFGGDGSTAAEQLPAGIIRGGDFFNFPSVAGVFTIDASNLPSDSSDELGFRCAR